ncbi:MAG: SRPBCC domain-containing protein [Gemmatimonadaceae bacterium]
MTDVAPHALRVSRRIRASRERLYEAWTAPEQLRYWWRMDGPGWSFTFAEVDLRVGGAYRLAMTDPAGNTHVAAGVYRELAPPDRLAFTWDWENPAMSVGETLVAIELRDAGDGTTDVVLTHSRFPSAERATSHEQGWMQLLALVEAHVGEPES